MLFPSRDQPIRRVMMTFFDPKSVSFRQSLVAVERPHKFVVAPSISGIASHFPSGEGYACVFACPLGMRDPAIRPITRDGPLSGDANRTSTSHAPVTSPSSLK